MQAPQAPHPLQLAHVQNMTVRLGNATRCQDWDAMQALDTELAGLLATIDADQGWSPELNRAMVALRGAHLQAMLQCAMASEEMAARLSSTLSNKEGWMAYAANSDWNGSPA